MDFIRKKKVLDALIIKHGMNIVIPSDTMPQYTMPDMFTFGKCKKLGECKVRYFVRKNEDSVKAFDDDPFAKCTYEYDFARPDTTVRYSFIAIYKAISNGLYYHFQKSIDRRLDEITDENFSRKTSFVSTGLEVFDFDDTQLNYNGVCRNEVADYLSVIHFADKEKTELREERRQAKVEIAQARFERKRKKQIDFINKQTNDNYDSEMKGFIL